MPNIRAFWPLDGHNEPWGLKWRSSIWFVTLVVGYGVMTDLMVYSVIIPVVPFQLSDLNYRSPSALTGWLLFAYSLALVSFSPVCSWFSEKYMKRRSPMLWGLLALMGSLVMFMEAPNYPVMVVARVLQGISSCVVWVIGLALLADVVPEDRVGLQLGLAMSGLTVGMLAAPPIGGIVYDHFGFRAPFIFGIIVTVIDFIGRLLVVERRDALRWGHDPALSRRADTADGATAEGQPRNDNSLAGVRASEEPRPKDKEVNDGDDGILPTNSDNTIPRKMSEYQAWKFMVKSRRTMVALISIFCYGVVFTGLEPTLAPHLQHLYGFNSTKVGLVILASAIAAVFATPISGWTSDRFGVEWITLACFLLAIPWYALLIVESHLAFFIACLATAYFMMAAVVSPLTAELSSVVRKVEGVGFGHVYGFFNVTYGAGSAAGPLVAGIVYSDVKEGWTVMISYGSGLLLLCSIANFFLGGERPLASRLRTIRSNVVSA